MTPLITQISIATFVAFAGGLFGILLSKTGQRHLHALVYAAMGVLLAVTVFDVLPEAKAQLTWTEFSIAAGSGFLLFWLIGKYIYHVCPACAITAIEKQREHLGRVVVLLVVALSVHCAMDGLAVVVSDEIKGRINLVLLLGISFHKFPEGLALALLLTSSGYKPAKALGMVLGIEATTALGALIGISLIRHMPMIWIGMTFAHVGGGFLYLVASTLGIFSRNRDGQSFNKAIMPSNPADICAGKGVE